MQSNRVLNIARNGEYAYKFNIYFKANFDEVMRGCGLSAKFEDYFDIDNLDFIRLFRDCVR